MATTHVNPTRMELTRLKNRLVITRRGHKLLKDKQDEMIRQFMAIIEKTKQLREEVETQLSEAILAFEAGKTSMSPYEVYESLQEPSTIIKLETNTNSVMNVDVPSLHIELEKRPNHLVLNDTPYQFDQSIHAMTNLSTGLIKLAELDKMCDVLSKEIEKTRRRVNAIEHVMIPEQVEIIKNIRMKLAEAEMSNTIRVMKSKDIVLKKLLESRQK